MARRMLGGVPMADHLRLPGTVEPFEADAPVGRRPKRIRRDAMTWLALGLLVALVLAWTTRSNSSPHPRAAGAPEGRTGPLTSSVSSSKDHGTAPAATSTTATTTVAGTGATRAPAASTSTPSSLPPTTVTPTTRAPIATSRAPRTAVSTTLPVSTRNAGQIDPPIETESENGQLSYPDDVATEPHPIATGTGAFVVTGSWTPGSHLELALKCGTATTSATGSTGATVELATLAGSCGIRISLPFGPQPAATYQLMVHHAPVRAGAP
jgi:hypothetical protein